MKLSTFKQSTRDFLSKNCDRFLHPRLCDNNDQLFRARVLIALLLGNLFALTGPTLFLAIARPMPQPSQDIVTGLTSTLWCAYAGILLYFRQSGQLTASVILTVIAAFVSTQFGIVISGGPLLSPALEVAAIPPLIAFGLGGRSLGLICSAITVLTQVALVIADSYGISMPNVSSQQALNANKAFDWALTYIAIVGIILVYETINQRLQSERDKQRENYEYLATHDPLTGSANRSKFSERLTLALDRATRRGELVAVIYLDLDGFKPVNDTLGHEAGDRVLQTIALRLNSLLRNIDTIARLGGDEFGIILENVGDTQNALSVAKKLHDCIAQPIDAAPGFAIDASLGIALAPLHTDDASALTRLADSAMYRAKKSAEHIVLYDPNFTA